MTTTLLAIDDSRTMRKALEITFAGERFRTILSDSAPDALAKLRSEAPNVALIDASLDGTDGYTVCKQIKQAAPGVGVIVLASKQQPYDRVRGSAAGADDFIDKPFDTQQLIDKVDALTKALASAPVAVAKAPAPAVPALGLDVAARPENPWAPPGTSSLPELEIVEEEGELLESDLRDYEPAKVPAAPVRPGRVAAHAPEPRATVASPVAPVQPATPKAVAVVASAAGAANLEQKLTGLGLTADQVRAVLLLSKEVVEQVVWEVVPVLAETLIKEEISRLTRE